jgi:hypothetical protein
VPTETPAVTATAVEPTATATVIPTVIVPTFTATPVPWPTSTPAVEIVHVRQSAGNHHPRDHGRPRRVRLQERIGVRKGHFADCTPCDTIRAVKTQARPQTYDTVSGSVQ